MAREIQITSGTSIEKVVSILLTAKAMGEEVYCDFNGHKLYSATITLDSAYMEIFGCTKKEFDIRQKELQESYEREERIRNQKEQKYNRMIDETKISGKNIIITMPIVIEGLKYIAENQTLSQEELIRGLLELGCNFTIEDIRKQFNESGLLFDGMKTANIVHGASLIVKVRDSEYGRQYCKDNFLELDDENSIYHFIRIATGNVNYTKENLRGKKRTVYIRK